MCCCFIKKCVFLGYKFAQVTLFITINMVIMIKVFPLYNGSKMVCNSFAFVGENKRESVKPTIQGTFIHKLVY